MKIFSKMALVALMAVGFVACSTTTIGNKVIAKKSEFELKDSVIVGKTTKRQVYEMYGEPTKNFGKLDKKMINKGASGRAVLVGRIEDEEWKVSNPKTTSLIMYLHTTNSYDGSKKYIPFAGAFMSEDASVTKKAFYIGFDDNDVATERWYSTEQVDGSRKQIR